MPYCKNCGSRITKFDKDICPVCGMKKPLEGAVSDTVEITSDLDFHDKENKKIYDAHFRITAFVFFAFLGWTGAGWFYLKFKKIGWIWLACNLVVIGGLMALFVLLTSPTLWVSYVAPIAVVYLINMGVGVFFLCKSDLKDGNGEFIH